MKERFGGEKGKEVKVLHGSATWRCVLLHSPHHTVSWYAADNDVGGSGPSALSSGVHALYIRGLAQYS